MSHILTTSIERDVVLGGEPFALVVTTTHAGGERAVTAVHRQAFARRIGGVRIVGLMTEAAQRVEVARLSAAMTRKCAAAGLPADGQKTVVMAPAGPPAERADRVALLAAHERFVRTVDPGVIFGPDMNVDEAIQDDLDAIPELAGHVTGLSAGNGGLGIDDTGYTAYGLNVALGTLARAPATATVQGFGAVGGHLAVLLVAQGVKIVGVSNVLGTLEDPAGIDVVALFARVHREGDRALPHHAELVGGRWSPAPDRLFAVPAELFVPAARTSVLSLAGETVENPQVQAVEEWYAATAPRVVCEGANAPLTPAAEQYLEARGVQVLTDWVVNCGGLVGCWVEHLERATLRAEPHRREEVHAGAFASIGRVVAANVRQLVAGGAGSRERADVIATQNRARLLEAWNASPIADPSERARDLAGREDLF
ncbi:MAG: Glu/Leu/Phe/Val dehydrogenase dimerization domain-containing protein [Pseudomonadota bacterium]|nr:Glu/Leu/Phe/Val dehydrogenase dimerization domain-containing protein [Pseudomonadota bacterium]